MAIPKFCEKLLTSSGLLNHYFRNCGGLKYYRMNDPDIKTGGIDGRN